MLTRKALGSKSITQTIKNPYSTQNKKHQKDEDKGVYFHSLPIIRVEPKFSLWVISWSQTVRCLDFQWTS